MSSKPENVFIRSVNKHLSKTYFEKMNNPWRSGTADVWYSGDKGDYWIEYKFLKRIPRSKAILLDLTPRQLMWLGDRFDEGRRVAVVLGTPDGGVIFKDKEWENSFTSAELLKRIIPRVEVAQWITNQVGVSRCALRRPLPPRRE